MHNCLILGSGRSGTSLVASMCHQAGYYLGEPLLPANAGNPNGRFESFEVNAINEDLLAQVLPRRRRNSLIGSLFLRHIPLCNQRWLAAVPPDRSITGTPELNARIQRLVSVQPFCFKDPRFSYTLPVWRPWSGDAVFICVFRHPAETAASILREHHDEPGLHSLAMDWTKALRVWKLMYCHILEKHRHSGVWFFVHYHQVLSGDGVHRLSDLLQANLDPGLANPAWHRSRPVGIVSKEILDLYKQLCALAEYPSSGNLSE